MAWLYPENVMLKKKYNGNISDKHLSELKVEEWNKEKVRKSFIENLQIFKLYLKN